MRELNSVLLIYNPNALKGKVEQFIPYIKERLSLRYSKVDAVFSMDVTGTYDLALKNASKYDIVVSCGGDGTFRQVLNGIKKSGADCIVGILPFGTCNDISRTLNIPKKLDKAIDCLLRANITKYDAIFDGKDYVGYTLATGYLTESSYKASNKMKSKLGRFAYVLAGIKSFFKLKSIPLTVTCDGERIHGQFVYMMILNGESAGGFKLNKGDVVNDGKVKVVLIKKRRGLLSWFAFVKLFLNGINKVKNSKTIIVREAKTIEIENPSNAPFTVDGEKVKFLKKQIKVTTEINIIKR